MTKKRLEELIGRLEPRMARRYRQVMQRVRSQRTLAQLEAALEGGTIGTLLDDIEVAAKRLAEQSGAARALVAGEVSEYLGKNLDRLVSYDGSNPRAVAALARNRLDLIQGLTTDQREAVGEALRIGHQLGYNPRKTAIAIRDSIGLTVEQTGWVANYRRALERNSRKALGYELRDARGDKAVEAAISRGTPLSQDRIDKLVDRYYSGVLRYRSETIARTETIRNAHEAHDEAYQQAIDDGHVDEDRLQQKWHTGPRARAWHQTMNGQLRRWGQSFVSGKGTAIRRPGDPDAGASECANCNCGRSVRVLPIGQSAVNSDDGATSTAAPAPVIRRG